MRFISALFLAGVLHAQILTPIMFGVDPDVKTPIDSPGAGTYSSTQSVTITDASANFIRYTTDGSSPSFTVGTLYTGAFNIAVTTTLKAIGCKVQNAKCGGVLTSVYTINSGNTFTQTQTPVFTSCSSAATCTLTVTSTGAGHLLVITAIQTSGAADFISSVSGGGTWVVPSGANTCQGSNAAVGAVSCAYVLSSSAGTTSVVITWSGTFAAFATFYEVTYSGGSVAVDKQDTAFNSSSSTSQPGPTLSITGTSDAIFQSITLFTGNVTAIDSSYVNFHSYVNFSGSANILNAASGTGPTWTLSASASAFVGAIAFK